MKTCPNCGCRVYKLGCVNCDEEAYIAAQSALTDRLDIEPAFEEAPSMPDHARHLLKPLSAPPGLVREGLDTQEQELDTRAGEPETKGTR